MLSVRTTSSKVLAAVLVVAALFLCHGGLGTFLHPFSGSSTSAGASGERPSPPGVTCEVNEGPSAVLLDGRYMAASLAVLLALITGMLIGRIKVWKIDSYHQLPEPSLLPPVLYRRRRPTLALLQVFQL